MRSKIKGVYCLLHKPTGRAYVGSSLDLQSRRYQYKDENKLPCAMIRDDVNAVDIEFIILQTFDNINLYELRKAEHQAICDYNTKYPYGFNMNNPETCKAFEGVKHNRKPNRKKSSYVTPKGIVWPKTKGKVVNVLSLFKDI